MLHIERKLQMEDPEDDDDVDDMDWEDMEIEDDMENLGNMYSLLALKKQHTTPLAESIGSGSSTFLKMIWVERHLLMHLLLSLVITNSNRNTECSKHHSISLFHGFKTTLFSILHQMHIEKDANNLHQHTN